MPTITTNDHIDIYYEDRGYGRPLVMIHGWGFSGRFFHKNIDVLATQTRVITIDLRGHGYSDKPSHGYRIPRLARDLYDVLEALELENVTLLGWSLGCPVIWSYLELFGNERLAQTIFVEQTPRQYIASDWPYAHSHCYDDASLASMSVHVELETARFDEQQLQDIMQTTPSEKEKAHMLEEMGRTPAGIRNAIMADHTRYDWRDLIPTIHLPSLVLVARQDKVFSWKGPAWVGEHLPHAETVFFENSSHALFLDEPTTFNEVVLHFLKKTEGGSL